MSRKRFLSNWLPSFVQPNQLQERATVIDKISVMNTFDILLETQRNSKIEKSLLNIERSLMQIKDTNIKLTDSMEHIKLRVQDIEETFGQQNENIQYAFNNETSKLDLIDSEEDDTSEDNISVSEYLQNKKLALLQARSPTLTIVKPQKKMRRLYDNSSMESTIEGKFENDDDYQWLSRYETLG